MTSFWKWVEAKYEGAATRKWLIYHQPREALLCSPLFHWAYVASPVHTIIIPPHLGFNLLDKKSLHIYIFINPQVPPAPGELIWQKSNLFYYPIHIVAICFLHFMENKLKCVEVMFFSGNFSPRISL